MPPRPKTKRPRAPLRRERANNANDAGDHDDAELIAARQLRVLLGDCSEMHVWRLMRVYTHLAFPRPLKINNRNYWRRRDVVRWIDVRARAVAA